jgi:hypothetical protein
LYNPPVKSLRPFAADYPSGAPADAAGRLTTNIEGRPLDARYVVGRKVVGGEDIPFPPSKLDALTEAGTGKPSTLDSARALKGNAGATLLDRVTARPLEVQLNRNLQPGKAMMVHAHENAHVIDQLAGVIPTKGLSLELKDVYNTLNNPNRAEGGAEAASWGRRFTPEALGFKGDEISREYMAEAIRAYMTDPNYLKTVAPKSAAAIREAVNAHPTLSKIIQFNTVGGWAAMNGIDADTVPIPKQLPPVFPQD